MKRLRESRSKVSRHGQLCRIVCGAEDETVAALIDQVAPFAFDSLYERRSETATWPLKIGAQQAIDFVQEQGTYLVGGDVLQVRKQALDRSSLCVS